MFLKAITLKNIRSYTDQRIDFSQGSTLLAGDIGSGKSSILLALEFGLFGALRSDLSADALLRKGTMTGSVELSCEIEGKEIILFRPLKKNTNGIKQMPGHIVVNGAKKELTALEMKAEIIGHLKYPKEFITKSKNYVFRYTVYCPQEEMKRILQESPQERLNILRKIFNIDKYKTIRDNLQNYLKQYRKDLLVLETKIEPLEGLKKNVLEIEQRIDATEKELTIKFVEKQAIEKKVNLSYKIFENEQREQAYSKEVHQKSEQLIQLNKEIRILLSKKQERANLAKSKLQEILVDSSLTKEKIEEELASLREKKVEWLKKQSEAKTKLAALQERISILHKEISQKEDVENEHNTLVEKQKELQKNIAHKSILLQEKENLTKEISKLDRDLSEKNALSKNAQTILKGISSLENCPTCLQIVGNEHKEGVCRKEEEKIENLTCEIEIIQVSKNNTNHELKHILERIEKIELEERKQHEVIARLSTLQEKLSSFDLKSQEMRENVQKNNEIMAQIKILNQDGETTIPRIEQRIETLQDFMIKLAQKKELELSYERSVTEIEELKLREERYCERLETVQKILSLFENNTSYILKAKEMLSASQEKEKSLLSEHSALLSTHKHIKARFEELSQEVKRLELLASTLLQKRELYRWLNSFFMKLTYTIEKEVLLRIYHRFNDLFTEWFALLMDESGISSRLDDAFTPVIEQNGHEIDFAHLSGGERTAVSLAYRLALNKVINDVVHTITTKNVLILDEPTDGFSSEQLDKVRDVLDRLNLGQILIVSHETKIESFVENIIRVEKVDHVSRVF